MKAFQPISIYETQPMKYTTNFFSAVSVNGLKPNEDAVSASSRSFIVVDGATGKGDYTVMQDSWSSDAQWFSNTLLKEIQDHIDDLELSLQEVLSASIANLRTEFLTEADGRRFKIYELPSAAIVLARINTQNDTLEVLRLGDCQAYIRNKSGDVTLLEDHLLGAIDRDSTERLFRAAKERNILPSEAREYIREHLRSQREGMNQNYWVIDLFGKGIPESSVTQYPLAQIDTILLATDGYYFAQEAMSDTGEPLSNEEFLEFVETNFSEVPTILRAQLDLDPTWVRWPRIKHIDDMSAVIARFN